MKKLLVLALGTAAVLSYITFGVSAYSITDQGAGAKSSVTVNDSSTETTSQSNSASVVNEVNNQANTGENSGDSVTGDAASVVDINNRGNINTYTDPCCGGATATPKPSDPGNPTATPKPGTPKSDPGTGGSDPGAGDPGSEGNGIGGGDVLGLSATHSFDYDTLIGYILAAVCLVTGSLFIRNQRYSVN